MNRPAQPAREYALGVPRTRGDEPRNSYVEVGNE